MACYPLAAWENEWHERTVSGTGNQQSTLELAYSVRSAGRLVNSVWRRGTGLLMINGGTAGWERPIKVRLILYDTFPHIYRTDTLHYFLESFLSENGNTLETFQWDLMEIFTHSH